MPSPLVPYAPPTPIPPHLLKTSAETIPSLDDLDALQESLRAVREQTFERVKKVGDDMRILKESMERLREKDKGKLKSLEKIKKERGFTPLLNGAEKKHSSHIQNSQRTRLPSVPVPPDVSTTSTPSFEHRKSLSDELRKKKKKRKLDDLSDAEIENPKAKKPSPAPSHAHSHSQSSKATKHPPVALPHPKGPVVPDFTVPPPVNFIPARPPIPPPPIAGPSKPTQVTEDFSKAKQPSQVQVNTFYTSIEPWLRPIKEEDIGYLEFTGDEVEPFIIPKLGRHYSEVWEEEDFSQYGAPLPSTTTARAGSTAPAALARFPIPKWEPSTLTENDCMTEEHGHGPLNERLVSALIPMQDATEWKGVKAAEEAMEGRPGTNGAAAQAARDKMNVADLEDRISNALRFHGILQESPDFAEAVDDPISSALRHLQGELRVVAATNKARRLRLAKIARSRLSYQEYLECRDCIDKNIAAIYAKLQKKDGPKVNKKKKKPSDVNGTTVTGNGIVGMGVGLLPPCPAALGLGPDEENHLVVPDQLRDLVNARKRWAELEDKILEMEEHPGMMVGLPEKSVFEGIDEEVRMQVDRMDVIPQSGPSSHHHEHEHVNGAAAGHVNGFVHGMSSEGSGGKGKSRARVDMEYG